MRKLLEKLKDPARNFLKYGVAAIMLSVPLYPKFPFLRIPGSQVAIRLEDFVIFVVFAVWFLSVLPEFKSFLKREVTRNILLFWAVGLTSIFFGIFISQTVVSSTGFLHWARRVEYLSVFFIGLYSMKTKEDLYFYLRVLLVIVCIVFAYGLGQKYFNVPIITTQNEEYSRGVALRYRPESHLVSTFAGHYDLASFLILVFPFLVLLVTSTKETLKALAPDTKSLISRVIVFIIVSMSIWLLVHTASRISLVSFVGTGSLALILAKRKKFIPVLLILIFIFAAFSTNLIDRYMSIFDVTIKKIISVETISPVAIVLAEDMVSTVPTATPEPPPPLEDRSTSIRLNVEWPRAVRALKKNPFTGTGYSSITLATDNDFLRMLGETGLLGFISYFLVIGSIFVPILKRLPKNGPKTLEEHFLIGIFATIPGIMLNMVFIDIMEASKFAILFWLMCGLAYSMTTHEMKLK